MDVSQHPTRELVDTRDGQVSSVSNYRTDDRVCQDVRTGWCTDFDLSRSDTGAEGSKYGTPLSLTE